MTAISIQGLSKSYQVRSGEVPALTPLDLDIASGEVLSVIGPSGCGKSTLLRLIAGIEEPSAGTVRFDGGVPSGRNIGMVFQDPRLFPWMSVAENIALPLRLRGVPKCQRNARAGELCCRVGLEGFEQLRPTALSGGMAQRAALARAIVESPDILLLDEPFGALDAITRDHITRELVGVIRSTGATVVLVTHSIGEAVFMGDRVAQFSARPGRLEQVFPVAGAMNPNVASRSAVDGLRRSLGLLHA